MVGIRAVTFAVTVFAFTSICLQGALAQVNTTNLLVNPGAETGNLTGWTKGGTSNPFVDNGAFNPGINPHSGTFDFVGGTGPTGSLTQNVALVGVQGITTSLLDSGTLAANLQFFEQGLNQGTPSDDGQVSLTFRNSSNAVISTVTTPEVDSHTGAWQPFAGSFAIPVGTRTLDYSMLFIRHAGNDLDAYFDDNSLTVSGRIAGVPEPGSLTLLAGVGITGLAVTFSRLRHRRK